MLDEDENSTRTETRAASEMIQGFVCFFWECFVSFALFFSTPLFFFFFFFFFCMCNTKGNVTGNASIIENRRLIEFTVLFLFLLLSFSPF